jgi:xanthine dehydrogenase YagR molybdenum-binding subunit
MSATSDASAASGPIGRQVSRLDGPDKVTGKARYAADVRVEDVVHAVLVPSTRPCGRIDRVDTAAAIAAPGTIHIFTHANTPKFRDLAGPPAGQDFMPLQDDRVLHEGQPVALVVADTLEHAAEAARLVNVAYREAPFETDFAACIERGETLPIFGSPADTRTGDVDAVLQASDVTIERAYRTADRHHNPMEPSATLAIWHGDTLTVHDAVQGVMAARGLIAAALDLDPACVRVRAEFIGGGFGCKGWVWPHQLLAAMAARALGRAVKLVLTRAQAYTSHGYQPASLQTIALGAARGGRLTAIRHASVLPGSFVGNHVEGAGIGTRSIYACPAIETTHRLVRVHRGDPSPMRAPLEGVGLVALEIAMDELAYELDMDPLELRLANYADVDPFDGKPFSSKKLRECYEQGARRFGWASRTPAPRSMRSGGNLVGYGVATALFAAFRQAAKARLSIGRDGRVLIETSAQEIGTGARTILPQIAADTLGVAVEAVGLAWGDTELPPAPMSAGSATTGSLGSAVHDGAGKLRGKLAAAGGTAPELYAAALDKLGVEQLSVDGEFNPPEESANALFSFGAVFAEVKVDAELPLPRVSRLVGVYSAGRIINPKSARSQMTGGLIWGIGQALLERSDMDHRLGRFLSKNLCGYLVPVNADVPDLDVAFVEEHDTIANPIGARGIGELGAIGVGAAIANAVFHATGVRVRELPIRPEHLLGERQC